MTLTNLDEKVLRFLGADETLVHEALNNPLFISKLLVEHKGEIICASLVRVTSEITVLFNPESGSLTRTLALKKLLSEQSSLRPLDQIHAFGNWDENLMRHFGFKERKEKSFILHF